MPAAATLAWLLFTLAVIACARLATTPSHYRLSVAVALAVTLLICYTLVWTSAASAIVPWGIGLSFDSLGLLLLPPLWAALAAIILFATFTDVPKSFMPLAGLLGAIATGGIVSANALFLVAMLQAGTLMVLLGLSVGIGSRPRDAIMRVATSLKYLTLSVVSAASLVVALLLSSFYAINQDRVELPRIIVSLLVVGFGLSVAAMPFYFHLPDLFDAAPPVVSALLIGPVQTLAFVYLARTFGNGAWLLADPHVTSVLSIAGLAGAVLASLMAWGQPSLNRLVAFTAIQEVGWMTFGFGSATQAGWTGALAFLAVRLVAKPLLILSLAEVQRLSRDGNAPDGSNVRLAAPLTIAAGLGATLAMLGFPVTAGFWGLKLLFQAAIAAGPFMALLLALSLLLGLGVYVKLWRKSLTGPADTAPMSRETLLSPSLLAASAAGLVVVGAVPSVLLGALAPVSASLPFLR